MQLSRFLHHQEAPWYTGQSFGISRRLLFVCISPCSSDSLLSVPPPPGAAVICVVIASRQAVAAGCHSHQRIADTEQDSDNTAAALTPPHEQEPPQTLPTGARCIQIRGFPLALPDLPLAEWSTCLPLLYLCAILCQFFNCSHYTLPLCVWKFPP